MAGVSLARARFPFGPKARPPLDLVALFFALVLTLASLTTACSTSSQGSAKFECGSTSSACVQAVSGSYEGTFSGAETGTWAVVFAKDGSANGVAKTGSSSLDLTGTVSKNGDFVFGSVSGIEFKGELYQNGSVSGTWTKGQYSGNFDGQRKEGAIVMVDQTISDAGAGDSSTVASGPVVFACTGTTAACYAAMAGNYNGTYTGGETPGTWKAVITSKGVITGSAVVPQRGTIALSGQADPKGLLVFGNASNGVQFSGALYTDGTVSGTWTLGTSAGSLYGTRLEGPPTLP
jgi:hypothetical protein